MDTIGKSIGGMLGVAVLAIGAQAADEERPAAAEHEQVALTAAGSTAQIECYDFDNVAVGTRYHVGDTVNAEHASIQLKEFHVDKKTPSQADETGGEQFAEITNSNISQGGAPELRMYLINAKVTPQAPVKKVELQFAENVGSLVSNLEVNGRKRVVQGGLSAANGKVMGNNNAGRAAIIVNYDSTSTGAGFNRGTLELHATKGKIETWSIGGQQLFIDRLCMTK